MFPSFDFSGYLIKPLCNVVCKRIDCVRHHLHARVHLRYEFVVIRVLLVVLREGYIKALLKFLFGFVIILARLNQLLKKKPLRCEFIGMVT